MSTRLRILAAARSAFAERGYHDTTMDEIAEAADVGRSTLFNYFGRKDDIVSALVAERRDALSDVLTRVMKSRQGTSSAVRTIMREMARWYEDDRQINRLYVAALVRGGGPAVPGWFDNAALLAEVFARGQALGDVRQDLDVAAAGSLLLDGYLGVLYRWSVDASASVDLAPALEQMVAVLVPGVLTHRRR